MDRKVPPPPQHQVFINFRGAELRNTFISHLVDALQRNEINFCIDKKEQIGEEIRNLFNRIEESKIALAVFSKRYTESRWCLDELVKMKECADKNTLWVRIFWFIPMDRVILYGECSYSDSGIRSSYEKEDKVDSVSISGGIIPLDLIIEILTRLPPKSLKRFQCVSKKWFSIIRSQVFIDLFNSLSRTRSRFLVAVRSADNHVSLLSSSHRETERSTTSLLTELETNTHPVLVRFLRAASLHTNLEMTMSDLVVDLVHCASVHGIFGLSHPSYPGRFTICNPSTRQVITLPDIDPSNGRRLIIYPDYRDPSPSRIMKAIYLFLGYDPVGNVYKALSITGLYGVFYQEYKVLTLGGGGGRDLSWRDIKGRRFKRHIVITNGICINGIVYYGGWTSLQGKLSVIYCFDVRREIVSYVIPNIELISRGSLINYNGKLGVVDLVSNNPVHCFNVDVLEYFDKDFKTYTWSRHMFDFHPSLTGMVGTFPLKVLGVNNASEAILSPVKLPPKGEPLYIYYAKIGKNFVRRVELEGFEEFGCNHTSGDKQCVCQLFISPEYFESLVSL